MSYSDLADKAAHFLVYLCSAAALAVCVLCPTAQAQELFEAGGLTFACDSCSKTEDGSCKLEKDGQTVTLPCEKLSELLLLQAVQGGYDGVHPSHTELRQLLLSSDVTDEQAKYALKLLTKTEPGRATLRYIAPHILDRHAKHLPNLIMSSSEAGDVWDAFWKLPQTHGMPLTDGVRAAMIVRSNKLSIPQLLESIEESPLEEHESKLAFYEKFLRENGHPASERIAEIRSIREACMGFNTSAKVPEECDKKAIVNLDPAYQVYFSKLQLQLMENYLQRTKLRGAELLEAVSQTNYETFRSKEIAQMLFDEIQAINDKLGDKNRVRFITKDVQPMLDAYARDNTELAFEVARLYVSASHESFNAGKLNNGFNYMRRSFVIFPQVLPERVSLLSALQKSGAFDANPALKEQLTSVTDLSVSVQLDRTDYKPILYAVAGVLVVLFVAILLFVFITNRAARPANDGVLTEEERIELGEILGEFGFLEKPDKTQLATFFRERAKELHPDTGEHPDADAFAELTERYERVKVLIEKQL